MRIAIVAEENEKNKKGKNQEKIVITPSDSRKSLGGFGHCGVTTNDGVEIEFSDEALKNPGLEGFPVEAYVHL